ncbi:STAS domain-containing protein [Actinoplanes sp. NBRC 103695]|uniref:STAS domain-containing protein n=1 Tax=Actinoplanes sp. NBRC 103695 TaxID=3032202 RepID=UPI0024A217C3|nr:STAS domain-containing protein [Actinoplanes sp. NBRC 103695]GLY97714.1 hypothetical protein Acsp02_49680 [Actinoplanes sp. NBRC 103695]
MTLSITRTATDRAVEVAPAGEIDVENAYLIKDAVAAAMAEGTPSRIELNMRDVTFIDSVGISALVSAHQVAGISGVKVVVTRPSRFAHRQLWVTGLLGLFGNPDPHGEGTSQPAVSGT